MMNMRPVFCGSTPAHKGVLQSKTAGSFMMIVDVIVHFFADRLKGDVLLRLN